MTMNVAVTGGRNYDDYEHVCKTLDWVVKMYGPFTLFAGDASGADRLARLWAYANNVECKVFHANWNGFGRAAGPIRNREMIREADMLIAFKGGRGTQDCIKAADMAGVRIIGADDETN